MSEVNLPRPPEAQLALLPRLQLVFAEDRFTATSKSALMISLPDLAVDHEYGDWKAV